MPRTLPSITPSLQKLLVALGDNLRKARWRREMTGEQAAVAADINRKTLSRVEKGDPAVSIGVYLRVMAVYGLEKDLLSLAANDEIGHAMQDMKLEPPRRRAR